MIRKAVALAVAGMVSLTGPALAADAQASAAKAAFMKKVQAEHKADSIQRASAPKGSAQSWGHDYGDSYSSDFWIFLGFGLISTAVIVSAFNNDDTPVSP